MPAAIDAHRPFDPERFLRIVDRVYAASCGETSWDRALEEMCRVGGYGGCTLSSIDPVERRSVLFAGYWPGNLATGFTSDRTPGNPLLTDEVLRSMPGTLWRDRGIMAPALLATTAFWTDWMRPRGFAAWTCLLLGRDGSQVVCLEVYDRHGGASGGCDGHDLLARLASHLSRAWRVGRTARVHVQNAATLASGGPRSEPRHPASRASDVAGAPAVNRLRAEFGLTRAEARLALYLAEGASLPSMAQAFDVKLTTIRSQLQQVFSKTGTCRQAELVALLLSHGYGQRAIPIEPARGVSRPRSRDAIPALQHGA
jgi:DNA-binding CsgD family transcriptional regulator